ncbi:MAG: ferrous iron transport protein A [Pirellulales bacterium]
MRVSELVPLSLLRGGQMARVSQLLGKPDQVHRLEELGLRGGAEIVMLQPGSPCIIRLAGQRLCFRADELTSVLVELLPGHAG